MSRRRLDDRERDDGKIFVFSLFFFVLLITCAVETMKVGKIVVLLCNMGNKLCV